MTCCLWFLRFYHVTLPLPSSHTSMWWACAGCTCVHKPPLPAALWLSSLKLGGSSIRRCRNSCSVLSRGVQVCSEVAEPQVAVSWLWCHSAVLCSRQCVHTLGVTDTHCGSHWAVTAAEADALRPTMKCCGHWQALLCSCAPLRAVCCVAAALGGLPSAYPPIFSVLLPKHSWKWASLVQWLLPVTREKM